MVKKFILIKKYFISVIFVFLIIINSVVYYYCKGINFLILLISMLAGGIVLHTNIVLIKRKPTNNSLFMWLGIVLFIGLSLVTYFQSPRYSYKQAGDLVIDKVTKESDEARIIDLGIATIKSEKKLNFFIEKVYIICLQVNEQSKYYIVNPITGQYTSVNLDDSH